MAMEVLGDHCIAEVELRGAARKSSQVGAPAICSSLFRPASSISTSYISRSSERQSLTPTI